MQINPVSFNRNIPQYNTQRVGSHSVVPNFKGKSEEPQDNKGNNTPKYLLIGASVIATTVIAVINRKKIGEVFGKLFREKTGAQQASARAEALSKKRMKFPELIAHREERHEIIQRNREKERNNKLDIDYYKDVFRAYVTIQVDRLNVLRKSTNPELKEMFELDRNNFMIEPGIMIHGSDRLEKKQLLEHFIEEAKKHDMDIIHIPAGNSNFQKFAQNVARLFPQAKENFAKNQKATMFVMEDVDRMLNFDNERLSNMNGICRGLMNDHTNKCGMDGVIWVSTVKDISKLDSTCYDGGGGRVSQVIDIDEAVKAGK